MSKTLETSVEISGVLSPSLQQAIQKAVESFNDMKDGILQSTGAGEKLAAEMKRDETVLRALERGYADFVLTGQEGTEEAQQLAQQIDKLSRELDGNKGKLQAAEAAAEKLASGMGKTETESNKLRNTITQQETTLQHLKERYVALQLSEADTTDESRELAQQIDRLSTELSENRQRLSDAERAADELDNSLEQVDDSAKLAEEGFTVFKATLANLAADAIRAAISGIRELTQNVVELGEKFSSTMSMVEALSGATGDEFVKLEATAREYGATTVFSASQSAEALKYMALAGWDVEQSTSALGGVLNLAAASGVELAEASDMVTDYMSAFSMEADQAAYFADILAYAQANSNTTAQQLGEAYRNCAANLNAAGQDVETVTSMLESMANQGLKGTQSGTALAAIMRDITNAMDDSKISIGETSIVVTDAEGNYRDLTDIIRDVSNAVDGMGTAERAAALSTTFTADSTKGMNLILNEGINNIAEYEKELRSSSGAAEDMARIMNDNLAGDMAQMNSAWEELQLKLYDKVEPALRRVVKYIINNVIPAMEWLTNHLPEVGIMIASIGAMIAALKWKSILGMIAKAKGAIQGITVALGGVSAPALAVIAAVMAVALAFVNLWKKNEKFRKKITTIWDGIKEKFDTFGQGITKRLNELGFEFEDITEVLKALWDGFCEVLVPIFEGVFQAISVSLSATLDILTGIFDIFAGIFTGDWNRVWSGIKEVFGGCWEQITGYFRSAVDTLKGVADVFLGWFGTSWDELWKGAPGSVSEAWKAITSFVSSAWDKIKAVAATVAAFFKDTVLPDMQQIGHAIGEALRAGWELAKTVWDIAKPYFVKLWNAIKVVWNFAVPFFTAVWEGIKAAFKPIVSILGSFFRNAWEVIKDVWNAVAAYFKTIFNTIAGIFSAVKAVLSGDFSGAWEAIKGVFSSWRSFFSTLFNNIKSIFSNIVDFLGSLFEAAWEAIKGIWKPVAKWFDSTIVQPIRTMFSNLCDSIRSIFSAIWEAIKNTISDKISAIKDKIETVLGFIKNGVSATWEFISSATSTTWETIKGHISTKIDTAKQVFSTASNAIQSTASSAWNSISSITSSVWNTVTNTISSKVNSAKSTVSSVFNGIKSTISNSLNGALNAVQSIFGSIHTAISDKIEAAKNAVSNAISSIKNAFNFSWSLPNLKLPHISITGSFSINPPSVPHFGISWYKEGGILTTPTIFGASGNNLLAGGEAGAEAVLPLAVLWDKLEYILRAILRQEQPQALETDPDTSLLQKAGQLLTLDDFSLGTLANNSSMMIYYDFSGFTWSPQIQTAGNGGDALDLMAELKAHEAEFFEWLDEFVKMREVAQYA